MSIPLESSPTRTHACMCEVMRTHTVPSSSSLNNTWITLPMKDSAVDLGGAFFGGLVSVHVQRHQLPRHSAAAVCVWGGACVYLHVFYCELLCVWPVQSLWCIWAVGFLVLPQLLRFLLWTRVGGKISNSSQLFFFPFLFQTKEELETWKRLIKVGASKGPGK